MQQVAVITGATKGIGRNIALELSKIKIPVILIARNKDELETLSNYINSHDGQASYICFDIVNDPICTLRKELDKLIKIYNSINILINCAGGGPVGSIFDFDYNTYIESIKLKQIGYVKMSYALIPYIQKSQSGSIINIVGTFGKQPNKDFLIGSMINASLLAFTKALSIELGQFNINVNAINPGATETELWDSTLNLLSERYNKTKDIINSEISNLSSFKRLTKVNDISNVVKFLISNESAFITGVSINVDGGVYQGF